MSTLYANGWVVTMDDAGTEHACGWIHVEDGVVIGVGSGAEPEATTRVDLGGAVATPGLINTHHHLYQTLTRARAPDADLFTWLRELYPVWSQIDAAAEYAAARTGLAELALSGCTTVFDHHYVFPRGRDGLIEAEVQAARELGVRIVASRGSMDLGASDGGLPPDELVEDIDVVLAETERLVSELHEHGDGAWVQIAVAPCSPFSVTGRLMSESAGLARRHGLPLHTHLAETLEEETYCRELYGCSPVEYLEGLGWLADDVWCAHCVHLSDADLDRFGATGTGVAHCPTSNLRLGAGIAPVRELLARGVRVGLGVDGSASNERGDLLFEVKQALLVARARGGSGAMTVRDALRLATRGGAALLGRADIGSLEVGKCADIAVWRTDGLELGGADDQVAGLVLSGPHKVDRLVVGGRDVVRGGSLTGADEAEIARAHRIQARRLPVP
jgi:cytosine/adenosine deaminase-related metal-dependent hydrolase